MNCLAELLRIVVRWLGLDPFYREIVGEFVGLALDFRPLDRLTIVAASEDHCPLSKKDHFVAPWGVCVASNSNFRHVAIEWRYHVSSPVQRLAAARRRLPETNRTMKGSGVESRFHCEKQISCCSVATLGLIEAAIASQPLLGRPKPKNFSKNRPDETIRNHQYAKRRDAMAYTKVMDC